MATKLTIAVAQIDAGRAAGDERIQWLEQQLGTAQKQGVELLVLPELFVSGYNVGSQVETLAESADGPTATVIAGLAQKYRMAIHYGFSEADSGKLYNAVQCIGPDAQVLGHYRKRVLPPGFEASFFTKGDGIGLFTWRGISIGMLICYDAEFPELARQLAIAGADIILVPTALASGWGWVARQMMPTRGYENGVYFVYANYTGLDHGMCYLGESFIGSPMGSVAVRAGSEEQLVVAEIDLEQVNIARQRLPYLQDCKEYQ